LIPKALSLRSIVVRLGRFRMEVKREERASGISLRRRPVKMSAKLATLRAAVSLYLNTKGCDGKK
jgi:hypothetical protein